MALSRALVYGSDRARPARDFSCWALIGAERSPVSCSVIEGRAGGSETNQTDGREICFTRHKTLIQSMRAFYCCISCIAVIDAEKVDRSWSTLLCLEGKACRYWTRSAKRSSGSARRSGVSMHNARNSPASSANWKRPNVCSRATARARRREKPPSHSNGGRSSARTWAADYNGKTGWRQARLIEPER